MSKRAEQAALKAYPTHKGASKEWIKCHLSDGDCAVFIKGYEQAEKELTPLINRLCEAILLEWKDAADLARETLIQTKARED